MRFALVGPAHPHRGGIAQYNSCLFRALEKEHEVSLISFARQYPGWLFPGRTQKDESLNALRVPSEPLFDSVSPFAWSRVAERLCELRPDAVVFQWWQPFFAPGYATVLRKVKRTSGIPCLFLCHNVYSHEESGIVGVEAVQRWLIRRAFSRVDGFLVQANELVAKVHDLNPSAAVAKVFHPLYDFYSEWDSGQRPQVQNEVPTLLFFGKIRQYKGLETLLRALGILKERMAFKAIIAGEFYSDESSLKRLAEVLGLQQHVDWLDHYIPNEKVPDLFRMADLVVLPYERATQSGVVPVAYQFEVPVIATRVGGLGEVVLDGETGYLVPPHDAAAFAGRICDFFEKNQKDAFRTRIREFRDQLSWQQVVSSIVELTQKVQAGIK